ncbi:MAG: hypothetical protein LBQ66_08315 [Planctomycetaceae bacterium]|nr:hypothetical protein [Planctomycetaceae bacterium]
MVNSVGVLADNGGGLRIGKTKTPYVLGVLVNQHVLAIRCFRLASLAENAIHQESPAVGCPPYVDRCVFIPLVR